MSTVEHGPHKPAALALLAGQRPRNVGWLQAAGLLFGDWGTSRLYVLGLAYFVARGTSLYLICMMSLLIMAVAWAYTQISRIYPDGGGSTPPRSTATGRWRSSGRCSCSPTTP